MDSPTSNAGSFTIIVNTYNRAHTLPRTLESLRRLRYPNFEVVVVNGPSTDGTDELLDPYRGEYKVVDCPVANLSISRNIGIATAAGDYVCFLDDDAVPEFDWLDKLCIGYADTRVAAVGGYIRDHTGFSYQSKALVCNRLGESKDYELPEHAVISLKAPFQSFYSLTGTNCSFRRRVLLEIGGFDEEYAYFLDETDLIVRIIDAGYLVRYVPSAEIHHKYASSHLRTAQKVPKTIYLPARSKAYFCVKNAVPSHSLKDVFLHLEDYRSKLRRAYDWYLQNGVIDERHCRLLHEEVDKGIHDGIADAFSADHRKLITPALLERFRSPFRLLATIRKAADRLHICLLSREYPPLKCGGIGIWTYILARSLAASGHEVTVVTSGDDHLTVDFEEGVWVHRIVPLHQPERVEPLLPDIPQTIRDYAYSAYDEVMRIHVMRGLDVVSSPIWDLEGIACVADATIPTVVSLHSTYRMVLPSKPEWTSNTEYYEGHVKKVMDGEQWLLGHAARVLGNSNAIVNDVSAAYELPSLNENVRIVAHGLESLQSLLVGRHLGHPSELRLLFVGRFEPRKGIDILLEILPSLLARYENVSVDLAGENQIRFNGGPPILELFQQQHSGKAWFSRIRVHGVVTEQMLNELFLGCDVFVAPSRYESFGLVFLEAMRAGKPCVAVAAGGVVEVVRDRETGILIGSCDPSELEAAVASLIEDGEMRARYGAAGLRRFHEEFSSAQMAKGVENVIRELIGRPVVPMHEKELQNV